MRHVGPGPASPEWRPFQAKLPVEPMPTADRTAAPAKWRQEKRQEEIVPLKSFACGYRLVGRRTHSAASYPPLEGRAIAYDQLQPCVDTVVAWHNLSAGRPCERRDPSPLASKGKKGLCSSAETRARAAAMSAIALTLGSLRSRDDPLRAAGRNSVLSPTRAGLSFSRAEAAIQRAWTFRPTGLEDAISANPHRPAIDRN
jgi:hypothetical protein